MAYLLRSTRTASVLIERTSAEARRLLDTPPAYPDAWTYTPCTARNAHALVRAECTHETVLYIDDQGRIRRAG